MRIRKDFSGEKVIVCLTIGFFDGVHLGHQKIIKKVVKKAKIKGLQSCVITFDSHPSELFSGRKVKFLTCWEEKKQIFHSLGVDIVQVFTFTPQLSSLTPYEFLKKLNTILDIREILVGEEFTFGRGREGDVKFLKQKQNEFGYTLEAIPPVKINGEKIGSSFLRELLQEGEVEKVARAMGRPPTILGKVIPGKRRGRQIGYPTANLKSHPEKLLPKAGVYAGTVNLEGKVYKALVNVGTKPTFGDFVPGVEVHLMDFKNKIYGKNLKIWVVKKIRDIQLFPSVMDLSRQLREDRQRAERILKDLQII